MGLEMNTTAQKSIKKGGRAPVPMKLEEAGVVTVHQQAAGTTGAPGGARGVRCPCAPISNFTSEDRELVLIPVRLLDSSLVCSHRPCP
jgi:hypothetical protein